MDPIFGKMSSLLKTHTLWQSTYLTAGAPPPPAPPPMPTTTTAGSAATTMAAMLKSGAFDKYPPVNTGAPPPTLPPPMPTTTTAGSAATTMAAMLKSGAFDKYPPVNTGAPPPTLPPPMATKIIAAADKCQRLHQLIDDFTKRELKEVLAEFRWKYSAADNRAALLSRCQQLINSPDIDVKHLSHVIRTIDKRKANRKERRTAKRSVANGGVNGDRQRPPTPHPSKKKKKQRLNPPLIANRTQILPPTVPIDSVNTSPPVAINTSDTHLSPPPDISGQEVVTGFAFRPLQKFTLVKRLHETEVLPSISDRRVLKTFFVNENDFNDKRFTVDTNLPTVLAKNQKQIQLRFTHTAEPAAKDSVPEALGIDVNGTRVYTYSADQQWCRPYDLSQWCRWGRNDIQFFLSSKNNEYLLPTLFEINIVTELTDQSFIALLTADSRHRLTIDATKALIRRKIGHNSGDDGISLLDDSTQVSQRRLRIPCRTVDCQHIECFDGQSLYSVNEWRCEWLCPICQASAVVSALRVDTYFQDILAKTPAFVTTIRVKSDGTYVIGGRFDGQVIQLMDDSVVDVVDDSISNSNDGDNDCNVLYEKFVTIS